MAIFRQRIASDVQCKLRRRAVIFQGPLKTPSQERFCRGKLFLSHLFVADSVDFSQDFHERTLGGSGAYFGVGHEFGRHGVGAQVTPCAVHEGCVLAQNLHQTPIECAAAQNGIHQLNGWRIRMAWRKGDGLGDVDLALNGTFNACKANLIAHGEFGGSNACERNVGTLPLAKMGVGFCISVVWGDVSNHNQVGRVGAEVGVVV